MLKKINIVCSECKSSNVRRDAYASWNTKTQEWELAVVFDQGYCEDCEEESHFIEIPFKEI